jgi:hypothetical protein
VATMQALTNKTYNGLSITSGPGSALYVGTGKTMEFDNTIDFSGSDGAHVNVGSGGTILYTSAIGSSVQGYSATLATLATSKQIDTLSVGGPEVPFGYDDPVDSQFSVTANGTNNGISVLVPTGGAGGAGIAVVNQSGNHAYRGVQDHDFTKSLMLLTRCNTYGGEGSATSPLASFEQDASFNGDLMGWGLQARGVTPEQLYGRIDHLGNLYIGNGSGTGANLFVDGGATFGNPLPVSSGGTGNNYLAPLSILLGGGTGPTTGITPGYGVLTALSHDVNSTGGVALASNTPQMVTSLSGINTMVTGSRTLLTVPPGLTFIPTAMIIRCLDASSITSGPTVNLYTGVYGDIYPSTSVNLLQNPGQIYGFTTSGMTKSVPSGSSVFFQVSTSSSGGSQHIRVDLFGYFE